MDSTIQIAHEVRDASINQVFANDDLADNIYDITITSVENCELTETNLEQVLIIKFSSSEGRCLLLSRRLLSAALMNSCLSTQ